MTTKLVKKTAKELASAFYDNEDTFNDDRRYRTERFRLSVPDQKQFAEQYWPDFVPLARKILAHMLNDPGRHQVEKDQIFDALLNERGVMTDEQKVAPNIMRLN